MLVFTRKMGEAIRIGQDVEVTVLRISNTRVQLGIRAPLRQPIRREELAAESGTAGSKCPGRGVDSPGCPPGEGDSRESRSGPRSPL